MAPNKTCGSWRHKRHRAAAPHHSRRCSTAHSEPPLPPLPPLLAVSGWGGGDTRGTDTRACKYTCHLVHALGLYTRETSSPYLLFKVRVRQRRGRGARLCPDVVWQRMGRGARLCPDVVWKRRGRGARLCPDVVRQRMGREVWLTLHLWSNVDVVMKVHTYTHTHNPFRHYKARHLPAALVLMTVCSPCSPGSSLREPPPLNNCLLSGAKAFLGPGLVKASFLNSGLASSMSTT